MAEALAVVKVGKTECGFLKLTPTSRTAAMAGAVSAVTLKARRPSATNRMRLLGRFASAASAPLATTRANANVSRPLNLSDIKSTPSVSTISVAFEKASPCRRSFDHLVGARKQCRRHFEAERLGCNQVDDEIEFSRLLDGNIAGLRHVQNLVHKIGGAPEQVREVWSIGHETAPQQTISMGRQTAVVLYVLALVAVVVGVDVLFFRNRFWERLMVNVGVVLVFWAFYLRFMKRP